MDIPAETERQKTILLFKNVKLAAFANVLNASLLSLVVVPLGASGAAALVWWSAMVMTAIWRLALLKHYHRAQPDAAEDPIWRKRFMLAVTVTAAIWGSASYFFMWQTPLPVYLFTGLILSGLSAGAIPLLAAAQSVYRVYAGLILVPMAVVILLQADTPMEWSFGMISLFFLAVVLSGARTYHETVDASIRLRLEQNDLIRRLAGARDEAESAIEELRHRDVELRQSEERYRLILQCSPTGILHYDDRLGVTYCNDRFADILGATQAQIIGLNLRNLVDPRTMPDLEKALRGATAVYEGECTSPLTGNHLWASLTCSPMFGQDGGNAGGIAIIVDMTERKKAEEQIHHLAYYDPLTSLPNRRLLMDRVRQSMAASVRSQSFGALLILDLDHFKDLNDTLGHDVGDRLLVEIADRLSASLRREDTVARLGGDEYVILVEGLGNTEASAAVSAETIAEHVRTILGKPYALTDDGAPHHASTSIGVTLFRGAEASIEALLKQADVALYQAKNAGRNTIRFFNPAMQAAIDARIRMANDLRLGIERNEFRIFLQPQVDSAGRTIGAEVLLRWQPAGKPMVSPATFIPLAEESGLILPIGEWVLEQACRQLSRWRDAPDTRHLHLAINVSARQFLRSDFVRIVEEQVRRSSIDPARLVLELTESVVLDRASEVIERMLTLKRLGVRFSLDDFGTGYSSLSYLKELPLDEVKIDQSFVRDITHDQNDAAIVRAILAMSHSLGLKVVAEGVETTEQRDFLLKYGCRFFQGYLFGKPAPDLPA